MTVGAPNTPSTPASSPDTAKTASLTGRGSIPETASGVSATTDYWHTSTRTVTLTVTDTKGQQNSVTQTVKVP